MKVKFTDNIKNRICTEIECIINGTYYPNEFGYLDFFVVKEHNNCDYYTIVRPLKLAGLVIYKQHTIPYTPIKFELDEKLFEWEE